MKDKTFDNPEIAAVFAAYPSQLRPRLITLRRMILQVAASTDGVGPLEETLRWGQPSYMTSATKSGSPIRIGVHGKTSDRYALFVHCQTDLVARFRMHYAERFHFDGNRAIVFQKDDDVPGEELRHCIALALTYHARKKAGASRK